MLDPALGKTLADLGGFALFLLVVTGATVTLLRGPDKAFSWVPGFMYRQERDRADRAEAREARLIAALEKMAREHERDARSRREPAAPPGARRAP